jgi:hypothetical protein
LINITHLSHIILYAEIRLLIMKYWALISKFFLSMSRRIWSRWRKKKTKKLILNHHLRFRSRSWLFLRCIFLRTRLHLQFHLQLHLLHI